jgi:UDP-N-acetylmuramyl pentapeptide phosphotransferase/UDP-N-acetylglucosamine-1-phosphate transferase
MPQLAVALSSATIALLLTLGLLVLLRPWLARHALVRPGPRSSHQEPTPQGGGLAVVLAALAVTWAAIAVAPLTSPALPSLAAATIAAVMLAVVGGIDDLRPLSPATRLAVQCLAVGLVIATLPDDLRMLPDWPRSLERAMLFAGGVWLVNLTNFMDGIDWMTVAEVVPVTAALALIGLFGGLDALPAALAAALCGAMLGFAPFNRPPARLFLGDVGSLPIGLLLGWLLLQLAGAGHVAAALILPLYYLADASLTLLRRLARRESVWQAHRTHFYQRATDNDHTVPAIVARVLMVNTALAVLALATVAAASTAVTFLALAAAAALVGWLLASFTRPPP